MATALGSSALADVITQWNFEAQTLNASTGTGLASLVGGVTSTFATGFGGTGTFALNTTGYAAQGTGDRTRGAQFSGSTAGYDSITLAWNERHSNTSANTVAVFATTDGTNWSEVQVFTFTPQASGTGDTWYQRSVTLSATYANAANFGFRVLAAFNPGGSTYSASKSGSTYATSGTLRFDDVTISGNLVPAPGAAALIGLAGLATSRRRKA
ncbi:MAG: PEP-CTERM sorting domain-containing protein [Planctomycetota bacterium]